MAADEVDEKSFEKTDDTSSKTYKPESDDLKSSYTARVEEIGTEMKQRVADYMDDKARETSSWGMLKDLRLSIVDSGVSILRRPGQPSDGGGTKVDGDGDEDGGPTDKSESARRTDGSQDNPSALGGDWVDNMLDEALSTVGTRGSDTAMPQQADVTSVSKEIATLAAGNTEVPAGLPEPKQVLKMIELASEMPTGFLGPEQIAKMTSAATELPTGMLEPQQIAKLTELATDLPTGMLEPQQIAKLTELATDLPTGMLEPQQIAKLTELATALPPGIVDPEQIAKLIELATALPTGMLDPEQLAKLGEQLPTGMLEPGQINMLAGGDTRTSATPPESNESNRAAEASDKSSVEGAMGDRSKDSGVATLEKPEFRTINVGEKELPYVYRAPDGQTYHFDYDSDGKPTAVTIPGSTGQPEKYVPKGDKWESVNAYDAAGGPKQLEKVSVDDQGRLEIVLPEKDGGNPAIRIDRQGTFEKIKFNDNPDKYPGTKVETDGTVHEYRYRGGSEWREEVVTQPGSHIGEVRNTDGKPVGYEIKDDQGHTKTVTTNDDGSVTLTSGDRAEQYDCPPKFEGGKLVLTNKDGSVEIANDGTEIRRDSKHQVTQITNSDGETTKFDRKPGGTEVTITDGQGNVVKDKAKLIKGPEEDGSYVVALEKDRQLDAKGEGTQVLRKADGTEVLLDKDGHEVTSDADRLAEKFSMRPEEKRQFKQDLADIDKLPPDQRKKVYESLAKIADGERFDPETKDSYSEKVRLTDPQAKELVTSLAHQIAHPESIQQGAHESCAAATMEELMARNHPDRYADIVATLATEGKCTINGTPVEAERDKNNYLDPKSDAYGRRSYTSELFQDAAIQLGVYPKSYKSLPLDSPNIEPRPNGVSPAWDSGERIVDPQNPDARPEKFGGLNAPEQLQAYKALFPDEKYGEMTVRTPADLEKALDTNGGPPMKVGMNLKKDLAQTGMFGAGTASGFHAVVITKIENGQVYYENSAGGTDHSYPNGNGVPIQDFVDAMQKQKVEGSEEEQKEERENPTSVQKTALVKGFEGKGGDSATAEGKKGAEGDSGVARAPSDASSDAAALKQLKDDPEVKLHREKVEKQAQEMEEPGRTEFLKNMGKFEERAAKLEKDYQKQFEAQNMKPEEAADKAREKAHEQVKKTYENMEKLLEQNNDTKIDQYNRTLLAQQCMEHCADTTSISQGHHGTCFAASVETRTYATDPAEATRLVTDVATKGTYTTREGKGFTVDMTRDMDSLKKQGESNEVPRANRVDGHRDYASQIFQVTAANVNLERCNQLTKPPGDMRYEQHAPVAGANPPDFGERLVDYSKPDPDTGEPPKLVKKGIGSGSPDTAAMAGEISPSNADPPVNLGRSTTYDTNNTAVNAAEQLLKMNFKANGMSDDVNIDMTDPKCCDNMHAAIDNNKSLNDSQREALHKSVNDYAVTSDKMRPHGDCYPSSEEEMRSFLADAKRNGKLPVTVSVHTANEPFWTDSGGGQAGGSGGGHVITITDYDEKTGLAKMQNQWNKADNHNVSVSDLYQATREPAENVSNVNKLAELEKQVDENHKQDKIDYGKEYELLTLKQRMGKIDEKEFNTQYEMVLEKEVAENRRKHESDPVQHKIDYQKAYELLNIQFKGEEIKEGEYTKTYYELLEKDVEQDRKSHKIDWVKENTLLKHQLEVHEISQEAFDKRRMELLGPLEKQVEENRRKHKIDPDSNPIDYEMQTDLLMLKHKAGKLSGDQYEDALVNTYRDARKAAKVGEIPQDQWQGDPNDNTKSTGILNHLNKMREELPPDKRDRVKDRWTEVVKEQEKTLK